VNTVNARLHRTIGRSTGSRSNALICTQSRSDPFTFAFGEKGAVGWASTLNHRGGRYSDPHSWVDQRVSVRSKVTS
jgi:hypothetical protein